MKIGVFTILGQERVAGEAINVACDLVSAYDAYCTIGGVGPDEPAVRYPHSKSRQIAATSDLHAP